MTPADPDDGGGPTPAHTPEPHEDERLRQMFAGAPLGIAITDLEGTYVRVNPAFCRLVGRSAEELVGVAWRDTTDAGDHAQQEALLAALLAGQPGHPLIKRYRRPDGTTVWARLTPSLSPDAAGRPRNLAAFVEDITDQVEAEAARERERALTRVAGRVARLGGWAVDLGTGQRLWTEEVYALLEHPDPATAVEDPDVADAALDLYHPQDRTRLEAAFRACAEDGRPFELELRITTFRGRRLTLRVAGEREVDARGRTQRVVGAVQDVTDLLAERASADAVRQRLSHTVEQMAEGLLLLDQEHRITFLNPHAQQLLGLAQEDAVGTAAWDPALGLAGSPIESRVHEAERTGAAVIVHADRAGDRWLAMHVHPSDEGVAVYLSDVTAERAAEVAFQERGRRLTEQAALLDEAQDAIYVCDLDDRVTYWNRSAAALYGWSAQEALGRTTHELLRPDTRRDEEAWPTLWAQDRWSGEVRHRHRDGTALTIETRWTVVRDDHGEATSVLTLDTDVSERRRREQQELRAQRMTSLGTLASGIAHDLNNVLSPILLSTQMLLADEGLDERPRELLAAIQASARRGADMVVQVVSFARGIDGQRVPIDVRALVDDVHRMARDTFPKDLQIETQVAVDTPAVEGDPTQLHQVLVNLAVNARDALRGSATGRLILRARPTHLRAETAALLELEAGPHVRIEVEDTGPGMSEAVVDRIFEPFFTTKGQAEGTGLGLSTSRAIIASHGGALDVTSTLGIGSCFTILLPVATAGTVPAATETLPPPPQGTGQRLLLVDDEAAVRAATGQALRRAGYRVVEAGDGEEAIARFDQDPSGFDLLLTDLVMPRGDGTVTIRALQRRRPDLPIVVSSGLHDELDAPHVVPPGTAAVLPKPYTVDQLLRTIAQALGTPPR